MRLTVSPADRIGALVRSASGGDGLRLFTHWVVVPATVLCLLLAGWYVVTGELPSLGSSSSSSVMDLSPPPRIDSPMPPRVGPEKASTALLQPPVALSPTALSPDAKPAAPADAAKADAAAAAGKPITEPPPPPALSEPVIPPGGDLAPPSFAQLPARQDLVALAAAPLPELLRNSVAGPLPIMADGKEARTVYARPFTGDASQPRIAVVVTGLGLSRDATEAAIAKLPPEVSLSFSPYAGNLDNWIKKARGAGHEVLMDLPLEPPNFPTHDAGPMAVLAHQSAGEAVSRVEQVMAKGTAYVGLAGSLRSPVAASELWVPMLRAIKGRGLLFVGDGLVGVAQNDVPASASVTMVADEVPFRASIDVRLARLLAAAQRDGNVLVYASPRPVTMERLLAWFASFPQKNVVLAPASAVVRQ